MLKRAAFIAAAFAAISGGQALAQADPLTTDLGRNMDQRSDRRLDRVEQTLREMRAMMMQARDTGQPVVVQPAETPAQIQTLTQRVGDLEETLRLMNSQIDTLSGDIAAIRRDTGQGSALNTRLEAIEKRLGELAAAKPAAGPDAAVADDPAALFDNSMRLFAAGQNRAAAAGFQDYLDRYGKTPEAPEVRYYLGEALYAERDFAGAANAYVGAVSGWPKTTWAPGAVVRLAQSLIEVRRNPDACGVLGEFATRYPTASAAQKAQAATARTRARCT